MSAPRFTKDYLRCPVCGRLGPRTAFIRGALGHPVQALREEILKGQGAIRWTRRPMRSDEAELVERAIAVAARQIKDRIAEALPSQLPDEVLASVASDGEFEELAHDWITEAREELERREALVANEAERRLKGKR